MADLGRWLQPTPFRPPLRLLLLAVAVVLSTTGAEDASEAGPGSDAGLPAGTLQERDPVFWVHLHNSGGTSLMTMAEINLEVPIAPASANWNRFVLYNV